MYDLPITCSVSRFRACQSNSDGGSVKLLETLAQPEKVL